MIKCFMKFKFTLATLISQSRTELSLPDVKMWMSLTLNNPEFNFEE